MFAIVKKQDNLVVWISNDATVDEESARGSGWELSEYNSSNVDVVEIDSKPEFYLDNVWTYSNGTWETTNQSVLDSVFGTELERTLETIRPIRNSLLQESDVYVLADRWESYAEEKKQEWAKYRQELRDLPSIINDPSNVIWPTKPQ